MAFDVDIEEIVRQIIAQLKCGDNKTESPVVIPTLSNNLTAASTDRLELTERLVTLATLENRLSGVRSLVLPRGAVLTPSARDQLRAQGVGVSFTTSAPRSVTTLTLGIAELASRANGFNVSDFVSALVADRIVIQRVASTGLASVVAELADHAGRGGRATLLLTDRPEAAACLANRQRGVRAVAGCDVVTLRRAIDDVAANLLAIDPAPAPAAFRRLIREYCAGWPRAVPALLDVHLLGH